MQIGIVGCGIIGTFMGWKLSKKYNVTILEQKKNNRKGSLFRIGFRKNMEFHSL